MQITLAPITLNEICRDPDGEAAREKLSPSDQKRIAVAVEPSIIHRPGCTQGGSAIVLEIDVAVLCFCYAEVVIPIHELHNKRPGDVQGVCYAQNCHLT